MELFLFQYMLAMLFIGKKFLISLKNKKIILPKTYNSLINSIDSIASRFVYYQNKANKNREFKNTFNKYFYHLRPGTYDLNVKRYNESLKLNEINDLSEILSYKLNNIKISKDEMVKINRFLIKIVLI